MLTGSVNKHLKQAIPAYVILAAIICAIIASCNSAYIAMAANFVHDIYQGMISPDADSKTCKRMMLVVDVTACVLAIFLAVVSCVRDVQIKTKPRNEPLYEMAFRMRSPIMKRINKDGKENSQFYS